MRSVWVGVVVVYSPDLLNKIHVVIDAFHWSGHVNVVAIIKGVVETLKVANEYLFLPLLCSIKRELVVVQKVCHLHGTCENSASVTG